ncbi:MAG: hypothetical protein EA402_12645 [Planctomycetota bacterium]|nr:MAG: hypothetical protein EA402_12645 [Planctomycetota bacterium]
MQTTLTVGLFFADSQYDTARIRDQLTPHHVEHFPNWAEWEAEELLSHLRACDVAVTGRRSPALPSELAGDLGRLRLLAHNHGTVKHLASRQHLEAGLRVVNWGDNVSGVAESALALLLASLKQLHGLDTFVRSDWSEDQRVFMDYPGTLHKRDVGLYGFGPIGRHMARMLEPFGPQIHIFDPFATDIPAHIQRHQSLEDLFSSCQCISIHCGLNDGTRASVDRSLMERLPQGGVIVNTARGPIIVEADLAALVAEGRIIAAVDVIENERAWAQSALAAQPSSRVLLTGHKVGGSKGADPSQPRPKAGLPAHTVENILALGSNKPLSHEITAEIYDLKT